jgi:cell division septum initiation protein DivIVA
MNEQNTIPAEMLDAAAGVVTDSAAGFYLTDNGCKEVAQAVLEATDVPALQERIASAEQIIASRQSELNVARARIAELEAELGEANLVAEARSVVGMDLLAEADQQEARIAELEAALRDRICEGCNALVANVGMLHLCGCQDQRNLCSAAAAAGACAFNQVQ